MQLVKTHTGNHAKQVTITAGGKWRFCGNFATKEQADAAAAVHANKGRKISVTEEVTSKNQAKKHNVEIGRIFFRVEAYIEKKKQVMVHATAAECAAAGRSPGPMND